MCSSTIPKSMNNDIMILIIIVLLMMYDMVLFLSALCISSRNDGSTTASTYDPVLKSYGNRSLLYIPKLAETHNLDIWPFRFINHGSNNQQRWIRCWTCPKLWDICQSNPLKRWRVVISKGLYQPRICAGGNQFCLPTPEMESGGFLKWHEMTCWSQQRTIMYQNL